jgi:hypothetical protein
MMPTAEDAGFYGDLDVNAVASIVHKGIRPAIVDNDLFGERVFDIHAAGGVLITGLTVTGGNATGVAENHGGGILNQGKLTLRNTTIVDNNATFGGGFSTEGTSSALLTNVTISDNEATTDGGGASVETGGIATLSSVTIAGNVADRNGDGGGDGGGIFVSTTGPGGVIQLRNTLLAGNFDRGGEAHDCARLGGRITSFGRTLIGNTNGCSYQRGPGDIVNRSAQLLALTDNGGPTATRAVKKTSPAIDRGAGCPGTDQRGVRRRLGGRCDIGAWELVRCQGVVINRIGTGSPELLIGTTRADGILGLGGRDTLRGLAGNDGLCGGNGNDQLEGGAGNDRMDGGAGRDRCIGGSGRNTAVRCELPRSRRTARRA